MIFLIPLIIFIGILFGIDYIYFQDDDNNVKQEKVIKKQEVSNVDEYIKKYTK
ncbi:MULTISPECIES: hypothetical protein [unclassified Campylobacter]|nr:MULTISPECIES: hypothetical protein [unclassified Campylobacter]MBZ7976487.1 hypothetical protein [Campylobacter sp. RM12637]MBZ7978070.1 hypothetical protein [Campylobacter sp. RM12654]MBZ7979965.1 hypothetical protein [Campylobacter sp. RM12642]MBZ7981367.1 hypothetical protein [Campylobacter sp. RM12640]MBZ7983769.1 hypothetical protein [Campylobacter sp. RM12647]MBZ7989037.1 hypothetical protein [Campylobacter sp. RM12635]MBZ7991186.1 hypothetical protein [Campylobacter sp. RM9331]MBZ